MPIDTDDIMGVRVVMSQDSESGEIQVSSYQEKYKHRDIGNSKVVIRMGYRVNGVDHTVPVMQGYCSEVEQSIELPQTGSIRVYNRWRPISLYSLTTSQFVDKTSRETVQSIFTDLLGLSSGDLNIGDLDDFPLGMEWDAETKKLRANFDLTNEKIPDLFQRIAQASNCIVYWDYDGKLIFKRRTIPSSSSYTFSKIIHLKKNELDFPERNRIIVKGRALSPEEFNFEPIEFFRLPSCGLNHSCYGTTPSSVLNSTDFVLQTGNYYPKEVVLYRCGTLIPHDSVYYDGSNLQTTPIQFYSAQIVNWDTDKGQTTVRVSVLNSVWDYYTASVCRWDLTPSPALGLRFDLVLKGYPVIFEDRVSRVYSEKIDQDSVTKYGAYLDEVIDNPLIPSQDLADEIAETEFLLSQLSVRKVRVEVPLFPLLQRWDRVTVNDFDVLVTSFEHSYFPKTGQGTTSFEGLILTT